LNRLAARRAFPRPRASLALARTFSGTGAVEGSSPTGAAWSPLRSSLGSSIARRRSRADASSRDPLSRVARASLERARAFARADATIGASSTRADSRRRVARASRGRSTIGRVVECRVGESSRQTTTRDARRATRAMIRARVAPARARDRVASTRARARRGRRSSAARASFMDKLLDLVTPKDSDSSAPNREAYDAWTARATAKDASVAAVLAAVRGTVLEGRVLEVAYDAETRGYSARAFHADVDGRGPCLVIGKTTKGSRFAGFNPLGFYSVEDYRESGNAFLCKWRSDAAFRRGDAPSDVANVLPGGNAAIFDFGAQGPCFGVDALRVPLGFAPPNGSSYAGVGGSFDLGEANATGSRECKSRLGTHYESFEDGSGLFKEGAGATLAELRVYYAPALRRNESDGLYVS
jgi:hypothetical protein